MDIKENNILVVHDEKNRQNAYTGFTPIRFKLTDFGVSHVGKGLTNSRNGTHKYMAPEQFGKDKSAKYNPYMSEIYSLGVMLFHLVFKAFPFEKNAGEDPAA